MKSLKALTSLKKVKVRNDFTLLILILMAFGTGCSLDKNTDKGTAKVGDKVLSHKRLDSIVADSDNKKIAGEIKREWVEQEVLYKEAVNKGILETQKFKQLMQQSKKELAAALLLKEYYKKNEVLFTESELRLFYENNKEDFRVSEKSYAVNIVKLIDEQSAIDFRKNVISSNWNNAINQLSYKDSLIFSFQNKLYKEFEFPSKSYYRFADNLDPGETSIVLEDNGHYSVVQLLQKVSQNQVPEYQYIKEEVKNLYLASQRKKSYNAYLKSLYSKYEVEIN
jgi:hypothetical protein